MAGEALAAPPSLGGFMALSRVINLCGGAAEGTFHMTICCHTSG